MDDVGQTLLNWASAFGTQEMVWSLLYLYIVVVDIRDFRSTIQNSSIEEYCFKGGRGFQG